MLVRYDSEHRRMWIDQITRVKKERPFLLRHVEACHLISALTATAKVRGDLAEVGVAFGASAKIISTFAPSRTLHLFDTFEGLPEPTSQDSEKYKAGQYSCSLESVQQYLANMKIEFHKGLFPLTAEAVRDNVFSFVHLDVDLYEGTLASLQFFYPRLSRGGAHLPRLLASKRREGGFYGVLRKQAGTRYRAHWRSVHDCEAWRRRLGRAFRFVPERIAGWTGEAFA